MKVVIVILAWLGFIAVLFLGRDTVLYPTDEAPTQIATETPEIDFSPPELSGVYKRNGEMCIVCAGKSLRCGDDLTREDLIIVITAIVEDGDLRDLCPTMYKMHYRIQ